MAIEKNKTCQQKQKACGEVLKPTHQQFLDNKNNPVNIWRLNSNRRVSQFLYSLSFACWPHVLVLPFLRRSFVSPPKQNEWPMQTKNAGSLFLSMQCSSTRLLSLIYSFKGYRNFDNKYATMGYILPYPIKKHNILIGGN